jgi:hypothetical protein
VACEFAYQVKESITGLMKMFAWVWGGEPNTLDTENYRKTKKMILVK